ncbi:hypothetical protein SAY87_026522 [Trapa incisa]|uniref:GPI transamidase component PIG-S n=1 Tax=Trapa incisa TaxID=236973 RepID=A0AAN7GY08_9MYRT|nr:hypothetical protein SAY87_026522 [Trapa incisa]
MAETSEISEQKAELEKGFDPNTMRKTKPGVKRLALTLSVLFSFLLGFPFLWKSIEIYRAPLPFKDIDSLSERITSNPLQFPCGFQAIFVGFGSKTYEELSRLEYSIFNRMTGLTSKRTQCGSCSSNFSVSVTFDSDSSCTQNGHNPASYHCGEIKNVDFNADDEVVDDELEFVLGRSYSKGKKWYTVIVVNRDKMIKVAIGKYRHAWIVGSVSEEEAALRISEIFTKVFMNGGNEEDVIHGEFMPVGADGKIILSFNLLNADPQDWIYDWDFDRIEETMLSPVLEALGHIANISVESQVLYHTPKSSFSHWDDERGAHIFSVGDLPFFVNSNEWHLDTSVTAGGRSKILHFAVYIPSAKECPLLLQVPDGDISETNGFISPMWGGIIVWSPPNCSRDTESNYQTCRKISSHDLQMIYEVFMGQLRQLFGLTSHNLFIGRSGGAIKLASEKGFTEWELDFLSRQHACSNLHSCSTTLSSLSRLVQSLPRMIIMEEIGKQVEFSLEAAKQAESDASLGIFYSSAGSSRQARSLAEDAFFHPSIMSVSYYSFEHCFAVYSPFFLPVSLHVILAALREWKRYKQEKTKYLTWVTKSNAAAS